jgi:hypothetical protein
LHGIFYIFLVIDFTAFTMPKTSSLCPGSAVVVEKIFSAIPVRQYGVHPKVDIISRIGDPRKYNWVIW